MNLPEQILVIKKFIEVLEEMYPAPSVLSSLYIDDGMKEVYVEDVPPFCAYYHRRSKYWYVVCRDYYVFRDVSNGKSVDNFCKEFEKEYGAITLFCHASKYGTRSYYNNPHYIFIGKA